MRAVIYARYSSEQQNEASIDDQLRVCREHAERQGWSVVKTYADSATSGATSLRNGYQDLRAALPAGQTDIVLAESLDRISRDQEHVAAFYKLAIFHGARIVTLSEGEVTELHIGLKGTMGALYLKDLAAKTRRGLEGRIRAGRFVGSAPYGYRAVRKLRDDGEPERGLREIDPEEASVVRRIFRDYAAGLSPCQIARALNDEGVPGPNSPKWRDETIRGRASRTEGILRNPLYAGHMVWRRTACLKDPVEGKRRRRAAASESRLSVDASTYRIVGEELWQAVQVRLAEHALPAGSRKLPDRGSGFWDHRRPRHLLTGKVICGTCGSSFTNVGRDYLACQGARHGSCRNRRSVRRTKLEAHVIDLLRTQLMRPALLTQFVAAFHDEWQRLCGELQANIASGKRRRDALNRKIANLVEAIADGRSSPAILSRLADLEVERIIAAATCL